jgi:EAL domain-containing protein (putative c-di-GMP-specific phosphodiesterase class I)
VRGDDGVNAIVRAVLALGCSLYIDLVAEGEKAAQLERLKALGRQLGQAFL